MIHEETGPGLLQQTQPQTMTTSLGAQSDTTLPAIISIQDAAQLANVSQDFIRDRVADGTLPAYRVGRIIRIRLDDLNAMFEPVKP